MAATERVSEEVAAGASEVGQSVTVAVEGGAPTATPVSLIGTGKGISMANPVTHIPNVKEPAVKKDVKHPLTNHLHYFRNTVLKAILRSEYSILFRDPVNPVKLGLHNYHEFVREPMDLSTIRTRLNNGYYTGLEEVVEDLMQMFCNCYVYNHPDTDIVKHAQLLEMLVCRLLSQVDGKPETIGTGSRRASVRTVSTESTNTEDSSVTLRKSERLSRSMQKKMEVVPGSEEESDEESGDETETLVAEERVKPAEPRKRKQAPANMRAPDAFCLYEQNKKRRQIRMAAMTEQLALMTKEVEELQLEELEDKQIVEDVLNRYKDLYGGEKKN